MTEQSILLVDDSALPDTKVPLYNAELDMSMMALLSSQDRSQTQFKELFESAGFELI